MRRLDPLTPDEARELDALERALAGEPVDPDLRELEELVGDLRATTPEMTPAFAARLERDVADGFAHGAAQQRPQLRRPRRWVLLPAAGVIAAALVALVVVLGQKHDENASPGFKRAPAAESARAPSVADSAGSAGATATQSNAAPQAAVGAAPAPGAQALPAPAPAPPAVGKPGTPRKVQRSAELELQAPFGKVESTSDDVIRTVDHFGGIVASSSISSDAGAGAEATFDLRVPTARLDAALAALSRLGHVTHRTQDLRDITSSFTSVQDRLVDARAERRGLLRALARATTQAQIDSLKARLRDARSAISRLDGDLAALRRRADLSTVSLTIHGAAHEGGGGAPSGGGWSPGDAAHDALRVLEVMVGVALVALAIAVPLGLLCLAIALGARSFRRRGRERALDPA
ncbi:MAG: hypothetical protein QOD69_1123 [Solirubrobacteraceae bacterium]|nr:hypothetical protein [Solirubrobacteraceae bacterium]